MVHTLMKILMEDLRGGIKRNNYITEFIVEIMLPQTILFYKYCLIQSSVWFTKETRVLMPVDPCFARRHRGLGHGPRSPVEAHQHPLSPQAAECTGDTWHQWLGSRCPASWSSCHTYPWRTPHSTAKTTNRFSKTWKPNMHSYLTNREHTVGSAVSLTLYLQPQHSPLASLHTSTFSIPTPSWQDQLTWPNHDLYGWPLSLFHSGLP